MDMIRFLTDFSITAFGYEIESVMLLQAEQIKVSNFKNSQNYTSHKQKINDEYG